MFPSIPCGIFIAIDTEALSAFHLITKAGIASSWTIFGLIVLAGAVVTGPQQAFAGLGSLTAWRSRQIAPQQIAILSIIALSATIGITALACAPNTWDVMEYHLPRVFEWMNNHSVGLYPTIDRQQLGMPPWAEYAMLHVDLLFGSDRLVNLVQWSAYVGSILVASLIAQEMGGNRDIQILSAMICATIPSAVLGASGAKNDCVVAFWFVLSTYFLMTWRGERNLAHTIGLGCTLSLSIFTKGTAYAFLPFIVVACALTWNRAALMRFIFSLPIFAAIGLGVAAPFWIRNYTFSGSIFGLPYFDGAGPVLGRMFSPTPITVAGTAANVVRNIALHLGTPSNTINQWTTNTLSNLIRTIGVDPNDPSQIYASQLGYTPKFSVDFLWRTEVRAGDNLHFLAFCVALVLCFAAYRKIDRRSAALGLGIVAAFVLSCALIRWSLWNARYHLPLFALAAPFTAVVFARLLTPFATRIAMVLLMMVALPLAAANDIRPLITKHGFSGGIFTIPRDQQYFLDYHREMASSFIDAAHFVAGQSCRSIGLDASLMRFEYPMLDLLSADGAPRNIAYSSVKNSTTRFAVPSALKQCLIVCLGCVHSEEKWRQYQPTMQQRRSFGDFVVVMGPATDKSELAP